MASSTEAANTAVERLRTARAQAGQRRAASTTAVEQLRERNREETRQLSERAKLAKRGQTQQPWPDATRRPREMQLFDTEDDAQRPAAPPQPQHAPPPVQPRPVEPRPAAPPPGTTGQQRRASDDDWSQESWLH